MIAGFVAFVLTLMVRNIELKDRAAGEHVPVEDADPSSGSMLS